MAIYWKGMTAEQLLIKRELDRINRQIRESARQFGTDSRLFGQYTTLLQPFYHEPVNKDLALVRESKSGIPQLSLSRRAIEYIEDDKIVQQYLKQMTRQQTVQQAKAQYIEAYKVKHGITKDIRSRADRAAAFAEMVEDEKTLFNDVSNGLLEYYKYYKKGTLASMSKGYWSSESDLKAMLAKIKEGLENEKKQVITNAFSGY